MLIQKRYSFEPNSRWKFIELADDFFLVNNTSTKDFIKFSRRLSCSRAIECDKDVNDIELLSSENGYYFKFYDDIYEITGAIQVEALEIINYNYDNDDVLLVILHDKKILSIISFWNDDEQSEAETFQELRSINLSLLPSVKCLDDFMNNLAYHNNYFYYINSKNDRLIIRFNSERLDTYDLPKDAIFHFDKKYEKYYYAVFDDSLIDIFTYKLYDISDIQRKLKQKVSSFNISIFTISEPSMEFIFLYEMRDIYTPSLITKGVFTDVNGFLYDYSHKQFIFDSSNDTLDKIEPCIFEIYDYSIPNIIKLEDGYSMFYIDKKGEIAYYSLPFETQLISGFDGNICWNRAFILNGYDNIIMLNNSIFLDSFLEYSRLNKIINVYEEDDAIKLILSNRFGRTVAINTTIINKSSYKKIFYLYIDDCFIIESPFSEYGKYTLVIPNRAEKVDYNLSFNSFKKFVLFRKEANTPLYDHLLLKCLYSAKDGTEKTAYIDVSNQEIVYLEDLIDEAFNDE